LDSGRVWETISKPKDTVSSADRRGSAPRPQARGKAGVAWVASIAIGGALAIAGCGSSSHSEAGDTAFVSSGNAACQTAYSQSLALKKPTSAAGVSTYYAKLNPIALSLLAKLETLKPPSGQQGEYIKMLTLWQQELHLAAARTAALKAGDERHGQTLDEEGHNVDTQFDKAATTVGLTVCARYL
jgi:hypothetical protein